MNQMSVKLFVQNLPNLLFDVTPTIITARSSSGLHFNRIFGETYEKTSGN